MLSLFETVTHSDCNNALLQAFLKTCTEHQAFVTKVTLFVPHMPHTYMVNLNRAALSLALFMQVRCHEILSINFTYSR